jgi:hypothetical protein
MNSLASRTASRRFHTNRALRHSQRAFIDRLLSGTPLNMVGPADWHRVNVTAWHPPPAVSLGHNWTLAEEQRRQ